MKISRKLLLIFIAICICGLVGWLGWNWFDEYLLCNFEVYVPGKSNDRFMEIVLDAKQSKDNELLQRIATSDAIYSLYELPNLPSKPVDVLPLDFLEVTYNYRVFFSETHYFDIFIQ